MYFPFITAMMDDDELQDLTQRKVDKANERKIFVSSDSLVQSLENSKVNMVTTIKRRSWTHTKPNS